LLPVLWNNTSRRVSHLTQEQTVEGQRLRGLRTRLQTSLSPYCPPLGGRRRSASFLFFCDGGQQQRQQSIRIMQQLHPIPGNGERTGINRQGGPAQPGKAKLELRA